MQLANSSLFRQQAYINGIWLAADTNATIEVTNPANGEVIGSIPDMTGVETARAIEAARVAMISWRKQTAKQRAVILRRWFDLIMANQDDLGRIMTLEQGKPLNEAKGEIAYAASFIEWFAEEGKRTYGDIIPTHKADARIVVTKEPNWCGGSHHTLELPVSHDYPQVRACSCCGLRLCGSPSRTDAFFCLSPSRISRRSRHSCGRI